MYEERIGSFFRTAYTNQYRKRHMGGIPSHFDYYKWGFVEFDVSSSGEDYMDFANSYLLVRAKLQRANGDDMEDGDQVGPVNNFMHSMFSQIDVSLNGTLITSSTNTYPYRAYIENLLSYGPDAKESQLTAYLLYKDTAGKLDVSDPDVAVADANIGLKKRAAF